MNEKKAAIRNVAIALGIICIVLAVGIVGAIAVCIPMINDKDSEISSQASQISSLQAQNNQLQTWLDGNVSQNANLRGQADSLQNQVNSLEAPKLIEVNLTADDNRPPPPQQTYLHVYGYVCNVGTDTAYNAILYVEAFNGAVLTLNTTISLGTINGGSYTSVNSQVVYPGFPLTAWHVWSSPTGINHSWGS